MSGCTREKDKLDAEVRRLCAIDGGVEIFEKVTISSKESTQIIDKYGEFNIPFKKSAKLSDPFYRDSKIKYFNKGNPEMWRSEYMLVRQSDNKILATAVFYSRRGGDFPGPWHDSFFGCPDTKSTPDLANLAIEIED